MSDQSLAAAADELSPIDNLYDANQRLVAENARLRAALERIARTLSLECTTLEQAQKSKFIADFALKD